MKFMVRSNMYKASNVEFNCGNWTATSYGWWEFVKPIKDKLVFNSFNYSSTTMRHQSKVSMLLDQLGIRIDLDIECPDGLQHLSSAVDFYLYKIKTLETAIAKPRTHKAKNKERAKQIELYHQKIAAIEELIND